VKKTILLALISTMFFGAYAYAEQEVNLKPKTPQDWRIYLYYRSDQVFSDLYDMKPEAREVIERAEGYGVFINFSMKIFLAGGGNGRGFVHDNKTGKDVFMRMVQAGVGLGFGIKDFRAVFVFDDRDAMQSFMNSGWSFGTEADAAVKGADAGGAASGAIRVAPGIRVYQITENGLALQATVTGTKYWKDKHVNKK